MWRSLIQRWKELAPGQQLSVVVLGICGGVALSLAGYRVRANIYAPFLVDKIQLAQSKALVGLTDEQIVEQQKRRDTDGDGLSDWDEANRFHTNPDLYDSCGDGIPDNIRIITGKNVDCSQTGANVQGVLDLKLVDTPPKDGQVGAMPVAGSQPFYDKDFFKVFAKMAPVYGASGTQLMGDGEGTAPGMARDATAIRAALRDKVPNSTLDKISDEQLLQLFDKAVAEQNGSATSSAKTP